jgi:hypothetical protein
MTRLLEAGPAYTWQLSRTPRISRAVALGLSILGVKYKHENTRYYITLHSIVRTIRSNKIHKEPSTQTFTHYIYSAISRLTHNR